jgi:effector-binding domain-containing protein
MKVIIRVLFFLLVLLLIIIITGLFLPKSIRFISYREISASPSVVFEQLNNFSNWSEWSPWQEIDPQMVATPGVSSKGKGAELAWKSKIFGDCKATMTHSVRPESIAVNFKFSGSDKTNSLWYIDPTDLGCKVNWTMNITNLALFERYMALFNKKEMQALIEHGMDNLKVASEQSEKSRIGEIDVIQLEAQPVILLVDTLSVHQIVQQRNRMINYVRDFLNKRKLGATGSPIGMYLGAVNDTTLIYACGLPVAEKTWIWKTLEIRDIPQTKAVSVSHFGSPDATKGFKAINNYLKEHSLVSNGPTIEKYLYNSENTDTANWEIKVIVPVQ